MLSAGTTRRWFGLDAARGLAIVGMVVAHAWPRNGSSDELLVDGRPSVLFVVVAGVTLGVITAPAQAPGAAPTARADHRISMLVRAVILFILGVLLWMLPSGIAVILDYYGVLFVLAIPLLFAARWVLAVVAATVLVAGPLVRDAIVAGPTLGEPLATLGDYLFTGFYPAVLWVPLIAAGILAARCGLDRARTRIALVGGGAVAAVAGYGAAAVLPGISAEAHSGTSAELLGSGGLAFAILGALLLVLDPLTDPTGGRARVPRLLLAPLSTMGRVALTVYVTHVVIIAFLSGLGPAGQFSTPVGEVLTVAILLGGVLLGLACAAARLHGPLEAVLSAATRAARRRSAEPALPAETPRVKD